MIYGYCRVSTATQSIERQIRNITSFDNSALIIREIYTGTTQDRPQWGKLYKRIQAGDTIIFDSVSRMSRNAHEGFNDYKALYDRGVTLVFLKERHIDTSVYRAAIANQIGMTGNEIADEYIKATNNVLMILAAQQIKIAFEQAQKEVDDLHKRTAEGMKTAKMNGKQIGRQTGAKVETKKAKNAKALIVKHSVTFGGSLSDAELIEMLHVARNTYYKYKREIQA